MSFFVRENRYVTRGSRLMIHERKTVEDFNYRWASHDLPGDRTGHAQRDRVLDRDSKRGIPEPSPRIAGADGRCAEKGAEQLVSRGE